MSQSDATLTAEICLIARDAGAAILSIYGSDFEVRSKDDASPVTDADEAAELVILAGLKALTPDIPVVAEESAAAGNMPDDLGREFWLVDPLDGTKEFISRNGEFTVNIALIRDGAPVLGVVYAPAVERLFFASGPGRAFQITGSGEAQAIAARPAPDDGLTVVVSRSHKDQATDDYLADFTVAHETSAGSSLKFCLVAAGEADLYPRLGRTCEWDTAAGHAVLAAAGGSVQTLDGMALAYGKDSIYNPFFVARGA